MDAYNEKLNPSLFFITLTSKYYYNRYTILNQINSYKYNW